MDAEYEAYVAELNRKAARAETALNIRIALAFVLGGAALTALSGLVVQLAWNGVVLPMTGLPVAPLPFLEASVLGGLCWSLVWFFTVR